jgi:hypothetical protein
MGLGGAGHRRAGPVRVPLDIDGDEFGRWAGIVIARLNAISVLLSVKTHPLWGFCGFAIDLLIINGPVSYGGRNVAEQPARV